MDAPTGQETPSAPDETLFSIRREADSVDGEGKPVPGLRSLADTFLAKLAKKPLTPEELKIGSDAIGAMVDYMMPYLDKVKDGKRYLPEEIFGKGWTTIFKNGSYGRTMENTLICMRTLAYNDFVNAVQERIGRPLTPTESFLASQMLYDIATDPQCLYCYVSLDRKAYNGFLKTYIEQRDAVLDKYKADGTIDKTYRLPAQARSRKNRKALPADNQVNRLYLEYLDGRADTPSMRNRFNGWLDRIAEGNLIGMKDLTSPETRQKVAGRGASYASQIDDAEGYAQSASWAKKQEEYRAYNGELLTMPQRVVDLLNSEYGLRFYSFSEYSPAFIVENMQMVRDAALRGLVGLAYTKEIDFAKIFAPTGININISCYGREAEDGTVVMDTKQGADWGEAQALRERYGNVGCVFVATNDRMVEWAIHQPWVDVVIPFHIVRTGEDIAKFYDWTNYTAMEADKDIKGRSRDIMPTEHMNDKDTFLRLCEERGLKPRFADLVLPSTGRSVTEDPNYMKLVNETRRSVNETVRIKPVFDLQEAKRSFDEFVEKGGYYAGWFTEEGAFERGVEQVAADVEAGKTAKDVDYGRQDIKASADKLAAMAAKKKRPRSHQGTPRRIGDDRKELTPAQRSVLNFIDGKVSPIETANATQKQPASEAAEPVVTEEDVMFRLSKNNKATVESWLKKREDLNDEQRAEVVDYIDKLEDAKTQLATAKWFTNGTIRIPEDMKKVEQAISVAVKAKVDPLRYNSPMELLEAHAEFKPKEDRINPDEVSTLHRAAEYPDQGIVVYDVDNTKESRENMRKIINTHFGEDASPWCLLQGDGKGNLTPDSARYWRHYNAYPKQVAFKDGKLLAFSANDKKTRLWWDRKDESHYGIPITKKMEGDELGRSISHIISDSGELIPEPGAHPFRGNRQNGVYEEWNASGDVLLERTNFKDGKTEGLSETWFPSGQIQTRKTLKDDMYVGTYEAWFDNGNPRSRMELDDEGRNNGLRTVWYRNGSKQEESNYVHGKHIGERRRWDEDGNLELVSFYNDEGDLLGFEDHGSFGIERRVTYTENEGMIDERFFRGGRPASVARTKNGRLEGLQEDFYTDGTPLTRGEYINGDRNGVFERFHPNGKLMAKGEYKNGMREGIHELYSKEGDLISRQEYHNDEKVRELPLDEDVRFRKVEPIVDEKSEELFEQAKKRFGTTKNLAEAGYVIPDGSMLDFSGRHLVAKGSDTSWMNGMRQVDHRDISDLNYKEDLNTPSGYETDMQDFIRRGAIRLNSRAINLATKPTRDQEDVLWTLISRANGDVDIDFGDGYESDHYASYNHARPERVLNDIRRYFDEGIEPEGNVMFRKANQTQNGFISNAEMALDKIKMEKATPEQWLKMLEKEGGLKAGEDKWLGLSDWLKESDKKTLTKDEVGDFIEQNRIQIEEQHYSEAAIEEQNNDAEKALERYRDEYEGFASEWRNGEVENSYGWPSADDYAFDQMVEKYGDDFRDGFQIGTMGQLEPIEGYDDDYSDAAKYFLGIEDSTDERPINSVRLDYTTPGLSNKAEIALTVPTIDPWNESDMVHFGDAGEGRAIAWIRFGDARAFSERGKLQDAVGAARHAVETSIPGFGNAKEDLVKAEEALAEYDANHPKESIHQRVLVIDEIQSKRHQEAREKGYIDSRTDVEELEEKWRTANKAFDDYVDFLKEKYDDLGWPDEMTDEEEQRVTELDKASIAAAEAVDKAKIAVPAAPFEKNWHELAMKRMLRLAAEEGYDKIAWTTGDQQADRYNLGGVVSKIESTPYKSEGYNVDIVLNNGEVLLFNTDKEGTILTDNSREDTYKGKNLSDVVGKDIAKRILDSTEDQTISGDGLRVGGEGMRGFYDDILPRFMNKYGKKWGVKVQDIELPEVYDEIGHPLVMHSVDVTPEMKESVMEGQVMFRKVMERIEGMPDELKQLSDAEREEIGNTTQAFNEQLENTTEENVEKQTFNLGKPGSILRESGVVDKEMILYGPKLKSKAKKHGFDYQDIKDLPALINDPIAVFNNHKKDTNRAILTEIRIGDNNMLVAVNVGKGNDIDFNVIASLFDKNGESVVNWLDKQYDTYVNKEKALNYLQTSAPIAVSSSNEGLSSEDKDTNSSDNSNNSSEENSDIRFSLRGIIGAENAEDEVALDNLEVAEEMEKAGKDSPTIWRATGWERGADGKWRNEIPDAKQKEGVSLQKRNIAGEILDAPELFNSYPELAEMPIDLVNSAAAGAYNQEQKRITLDTDYNTTFEMSKEDKKKVEDSTIDFIRNGIWKRQSDIVKFKNGLSEQYGKLVLNSNGIATLLHELQHAIQQIEGFAKGTNEKLGERLYYKEALKTKPEETYFAWFLSRKNSAKKLNQIGRERVIRYAEIYDKSRLEDEDLAYLNKLIDYLKGISDDEYKKLVSRAAKIVKAAEKAGEESYEKSAGEVEARNVERRSTLSDEKRQKYSPEATEEYSRSEQIVQFRKVTDPATLERLESEEKIPIYASKQFIEDPNGDAEYDFGDGRGAVKGFLVAPMSGKVEGKWRDPERLGDFQEAEERPDLVNEKGEFILDKGNGDSLKVAYAPYNHLRRSPLNEQFSSAYKRPNLVIVKGEIPASELTSGYTAEKSKKSTGEHDWPSGKVSNALAKKGQDTRKVILSRWFKPIEVVPASKVADEIVKKIDDAGIKISFNYNVVTPTLRRELVKRGVKFSGWQGKKPDDWKELVQRMQEENNDIVLFRRSQDLFNESREGGLAGLIGDQDASELYRNVYRAIPKEIRERIVSKAGDGFLFSEATKDMISEAVEKGDKTGIAGLAANMLRDYVGDLDERTARYILWRGDRKVEDDDLLDTVNDIAMQRRLQVGEFAEQPMFRKSPITPEQDKEYMEAVQAGDMEKARQMVREAAALAMPDTKVVDEDEKPTIVYHGSSWNPLEEKVGEGVFKDSFRGTGSGDNGFFGRGFYFTYGNGILSRAEAGYYGPTITEAFLNIENPFLFNETLYEYNGARNIGEEKNSVEAINMAKNFPELCEGIFLTTVNRKGEVDGEIALEDYAALFEDVYRNKEFIVNETEDSNIIEVLADPVTHRYTNPLGKEIEWTDYAFRLQMYRPGKNEDAQLAFAHFYLTDMTDLRREDAREMAIELPSNLFSGIFESEEFTDTLKARGYDGVLQSTKGDEAVAFNANQIKSAEPVTYDGNGKVVPLSERFNPDSEDIRFRLADNIEENQNRADSMADDAKATLDEKKEQARKDDALTTIKAMSLQKEYDRKTVNAITVLAKNIIKDQDIDSLNRREIARLLSIVTTTVGKAPKTMKKNADALVGMIVDHLLKSEAAALDKVAKVKATSTTSKGVTKMGDLDVFGQNVIKAYRAGLELKVSSEDAEEVTILTSLSLARERMESRDESVRKQAEAEFEGLMLAQEYLERIQAKRNEERGLKNELDKKAEEFRDGKISRTAYNQFVSEWEGSMRSNKIDRIEAYRELRAKLQDRIAGSKRAKKDFLEAEKARIDHIHHVANSDMQGVTADNTEQPKGQGFVNSGLMRFFSSSLVTFDQMLKLFGRKSVTGEGHLWNYFMRNGWLKARDNEVASRREVVKEMDAKASEVFDKEMRWVDLAEEDRKLPKAKVTWRVNGVEKEFEVTQGQLLYIYMVNKMQDGRMKLRAMGITQEDVERIARSIDDRFLELGDWLQDEFLVKLRNKYDKVHVRLFGASMAAIEDYFPLVVNKRALEKPVEVGAPTIDPLPATTTGAIIQRRRNAYPLDILNANAFFVAASHVDQMEHWAAFAELNRDLGTLLSYKRFRNQVENMVSVFGSGPELWERFRKVVDISVGAYRPKESESSLISNFGKGVTAAKISFRVYTALKQFLSMPAFFVDANIKYLAGNIAAPWKAWNWALENLPLVRERWESRFAGDTRLMKNESDWKLFRDKNYERLSRWGMSPNAFVDALTVSIGAHSMYQTRYDRYIKDGYTKEQADKKAKQDATILYNETQQSNEAAFTSALQLDRDPMSVALSVYRNSSMGYQRKYHEALRNLSRRSRTGFKETSVESMKRQMMQDGLSEEQASHAAERMYNRQFWHDLASVGLFGHVMQLFWNLGPFMAYLLLGGDDDEKEKEIKEAVKHSLWGPVEGLPFGNIISEAGNLLFSKGGVKNLNNYDPSLLPLFSDVKQMIQHMSYDQPRAWNEIINIAAQAFTGVNPQTFADTVVAVVDACGGDLDTSKEAMLLIMRVLQVPQSQIDQIYIDELGTNAAGAKRMSYGEMAERYARYKVAKGAPLTGWAYGDEAEEKREKAYLKRFKTMTKERKELSKPKKK